MLKFLLSILFIIPSVTYAADLCWDYDKYHNMSDGYKIYITSEKSDYIKNVDVDKTVVDGSVVIYKNIDYNLGLNIDEKYYISLTRYNEHMESDHSETVEYTPSEDEQSKNKSSDTCFIKILGK